MDFYFIIFSTLVCGLLGFLRYKFSYWELNGVAQLPPNFIFGNYFKHQSLHHSNILQEVYNEFKSKAKLAGTYIFLKPVAVIIDLDLVKSILVRDFNKFVNRMAYDNEEDDPIAGHLFNLGGEKWRALRSKLSPTFTSGKMKFMFPTVVNVAKEFEEVFNSHLKETPDGNIEIYDFMGRYTTDVIGTCAFGIKCNSLKDPNVSFRKMGKRIFSTESSIRWRLFLRTYSNYLKLIGLKRIPRYLKDFFVGIVNDTVATREKLNIQRNDFIDLLIDLKNTKDVNGQPILNDNQMVAQVFIFFAAGFETSSSNMTFGLYELARNPIIQEKAREEIIQILEKYDGEITYEAMMEMRYLDQIVTETLRKYPALPGLTRISQEDYLVPGTNVILRKDTEVIIPVRAIHYDPDIYKNPEEFQPERFDSKEVQQRHSQSFLGFGDGPRNCIGLRFGRMQVRVGLIMLLKKFRFIVSEKTPEILEYSKGSIVLTPGLEVWLKVESL